MNIRINTLPPINVLATAVKVIIEFIHKLDASCFNNLQQVCKYQVAASLIFTDLLQLDEIDKLAATC